MPNVGNRKPIVPLVVVNDDAYAEPEEAGVQGGVGRRVEGNQGPFAVEQRGLVDEVARTVSSTHLVVSPGANVTVPEAAV